MLRKFLLPALAAATLAGCATGYSYRNGSGGDYYYGQPQVEYRYYGSYGPYGYSPYGYGYGAYSPRYYYDRYGRLVYGSPYGYGGYYGSPYGYGYPYSHGQPPRGHGHDRDDDDHDDDRSEPRPPPWRNLGGLMPPERVVERNRKDVTPMVREQAPFIGRQAPMVRVERPVPMRPQVRPMQRTQAAPIAPRMRSTDGGSRIGGAVRRAKMADPTEE